MMSASQLSAAIRAKKKAIANAEPEIVDTSPVPDMNATDILEKKTDGYVEDTLDSPKKINADETSMNEASEESLKAMRDARMGRLRSYLNGMKVSD
jgi:hypothetical protein